MATAAPAPHVRIIRGYRQWLPDMQLGLQNLLLHRLRSLLTMLGMIFGVAAVVSMLSIGAGARQKVMALIEQMGVHNLIVEAKETTEWQAHQKVRKLSQGLSFQDYRVIRDDVNDIVAATPRKRMTLSKTIPKAQQDPPTVYGVNPNYVQIAGLHVLQGRFFNEDEETRGRASRRAGRGGTLEPVRFRGSGRPVCKSQRNLVPRDRSGLAATEFANRSGRSAHAGSQQHHVRSAELGASCDSRITTATYAMRSTASTLNIRDSADMASVAQVVRAILDSSHHSAGDFSVIVPAELLAEQKRTERLFNAVMVAIASISLLVGGIGIMNIMLASILERTREIGVRRAVGARQSDIIRQFVVEAMLISFVGGSFGILFGFVMSRLIALLAGWSTIVTLSSILLAFIVSITVGLVFGIYPAVKAARLDPVEAIRWE